MQSTPASCSSPQILPVMPKPAAAFSPFTATKSRPSSRRRRGTSLITMSRPGRPTMSPQNRTFMPSTFQSRVGYTLDKGASALVGQQPIEPLIGRAVRNLGHELSVEANSHGRDLVPGPQRRERAIVEAAAVAQAPSLFIAGKQWNDQRFRLERLALGRRLQGAEHAGFERIAGPPGAKQQTLAAALHDRQRQLAAGIEELDHQRADV